MVEFLSRGRFVELPGATARRIRANAWEIRIPRTEAVRGVVRSSLSPEAFDDAIFCIDGVETEHAVGSGEEDHLIRVSALLP